MFRSQENHFTPPLSLVVLWAIRVLSLMAIVLSGYLVWESVKHASVLGCSGSETFDCDKVLASHWSKVLGIPIALLGSVCYLSIFLVSFLAGSRNARVARWGIGLLALLSTAAAGSAIWFSALQFVNIGALCLYCLCTHLCGIALAGSLFIALAKACGEAQYAPRPISHLQSVMAVSRPIQQTSFETAAITNYSQLGLPIFAGLVCLTAVVGTQALFPGKTNEVANASDVQGSFDLTQPNSETIINAELEPHVTRRLPGEIETEKEIEARPSYTADDYQGVETSPEMMIEMPTKEADVADITLQATDDLIKVAKPKPSLPTQEKASRIVELLEGKLKFNIYDYPYIGSPEASQVIVEMFDYTCIHCRAMHQRLEEARKRYPDQFTIVLMPVPLEKRCNSYIRKARPQNLGSCKLAALSLAVAEVDQTQFDRFHYWMMRDPEKTRPYDKSLLRAYDMLGSNALRKKLKEDAIATKLQKSIRLFNNLQDQWKGDRGFGLPVLIAGDTMSSGGFEDNKDLFQLLENSLALQQASGN